MGGMKKLAVIAAIGVGMVLAACDVADAGPRWRLRRWSSRAPIDPTIRTTTSFRAPNYRWPAPTPRHYYRGGGVRVIIR